MDRYVVGTVGGIGTSGKRTPGLRVKGRRTRSHISVGVVLPCIAILLVLAAPLASATAATTVKAPYSGWNISQESSKSGPCSATIKILKYPNFNSTSGHGVGGGNVSTRSCPGPTSGFTIPAQTEVVGFLAAQISGLSGPTHFKVHWVLSYAGKLHVHSGGSGQFAEAGAGVSVQGFLYNGTATVGSFTTVSFDYGINTTVGSNLPFSVSKLGVNVYLNVSLSSTVGYSLEAQVNLGLECEVSLGGTSSADAQLSMYGSSGGATLSYYSY
jgi:hypothetical protein